MNKGTCEDDGVALAVLASERSEMDAKAPFVTVDPPTERLSEFVWHSAATQHNSC
jgi:hypothetical protein